MVQSPSRCVGLKGDDPLLKPHKILFYDVQNFFFLFLLGKISVCTQTNTRFNKIKASFTTCRDPFLKALNVWIENNNLINLQAVEKMCHKRLTVINAVCFRQILHFMTSFPKSGLKKKKKKKSKS